MMSVATGARSASVACYYPRDPGEVILYLVTDMVASELALLDSL